MSYPSSAPLPPRNPSEYSGNLRSWDKTNPLAGKKLLPIIILGVLTLLLISALLWCLLVKVNFKLTNISAQTPEENDSTYKVITYANKPILEVGYCIHPDDPKDLSEYRKANAGGGLFRKTYRVDASNIVAGENDLHVYAKTIFGTYFKVYELELPAGTTSGEVINAVTGDRISGANIEFRRGIDERYADPVATVTSSSNGSYSISLPAGDYTMHVTMTGFMEEYMTVQVLANQDSTDRNCVLSPALSEGEIRIVLTWGADPSDLDSHLYGPGPNGSTFHTWYPDYEKTATFNGVLYANLDLDDTTSYGPETTTIYIQESGQYSFYVHDYTNRGNTSSTALAHSDAQVKVYMANREPMVFNVPSGAGTVWHVFTLENGYINPVNRITDESAMPNY